MLNGNNASVNGLWGSGTIDSQGGGNITLSVGNGNVSSTFGGTIQNSGGGSGGLLGLTKTGLGVLTLTGTNNTFSGNGLSVSGGTLVAGGAGVLSPNANVFVNTATLDVSAGSQTIPYLSMSPNGTLIMAGSATLDVTDTVAVTMSGTLDVTSTPGAGTWDLISYANSGSSTFADAVLPAHSTLVYTSTELELVTTAAPSGPATWIGGNGNWSVGSNWSTNAANTSGQGVTVAFSQSISGTNTITLDGAETVGTLQLGTTTGIAGTSYLLSGSGTDSLTLSNTGSNPSLISVSNGSHVISAPVILAGNLDVSSSAVRR